MVAFGLYPKILGGGGDLWIIFLLENECSLSGVDNHRWWGHSNLKKKKLYALSGSGHIKLCNFPYLLSTISLALELVPYTIHLMKLSLPNILFLMTKTLTGLTRPSSTRFVTMMILRQFTCHAMCQMSPNVCLLGPANTFYHR